MCMQHSVHYKNIGSQPLTNGIIDISTSRKDTTMSDILKLPEFVQFVVLKGSPEVRRVVSYDRFFEGKGAYMTQVPSGKNDGTMIIDKYTENQVEHKFFSKDEAETYKQEKGHYTNGKL